MSLFDKIKAHPAVDALWLCGGRWVVELRTGWECNGSLEAGLCADFSWGGSSAVAAIRLRDLWTAVQAAKCEEVAK